MTKGSAEPAGAAPGRSGRKEAAVHLPRAPSVSPARRASPSPPPPCAVRLPRAPCARLDTAQPSAPPYAWLLRRHRWRPRPERVLVRRGRLWCKGGSGRARGALSLSMYKITQMNITGMLNNDIMLRKEILKIIY